MLTAGWITKKLHARDWFPFMNTRSPSLLRYELIEELDAGSWFNPAFKGEMIPTLGDAFHVAGVSRPMGVMVEIKGEALSYGEQSIISILKGKIDAAGLPNPTAEFGGLIVTSFYPQPLQDIAQLAPEVALFQLVPPLEMNKGKALRRLVEHYALRGIMFAGDDVSDLDAVREIRQMKQEGIDAISVAVKHLDTPPALLREADIAVEQVDGMAELLGEIVAAL